MNKSFQHNQPIWNNLTTFLFMAPQRRGKHLRLMKRAISGPGSNSPLARKLGRAWQWCRTQWTSRWWWSWRSFARREPPGTSFEMFLWSVSKRGHKQLTKCIVQTKLTVTNFLSIYKNTSNLVEKIYRKYSRKN